MRGVRLLDLATTMSLIYFPPSLVASEARSKPGGFFLGGGVGGSGTLAWKYSINTKIKPLLTRIRRSSQGS